ncbi:putative epithelial chloride channel protein-like [Apostichopus japonicus]|uniref:Putative epithelial chloride channel protein-like n=1 Tax=Stichopus japonicus TaxID=307972 RepID=A0A2G8KYP9_STIJA|nr:putative epithelial chloride channel protein-like [Apostichopus japonicus]
MTYFKEVRILIPSTWSDNPSYVSAVSESFQNSDVRIDNPGEDSSFPNINRPYTAKPTFCGSQGLYIHLTPEFVTNGDIANVYGGYDKVLAHEWAHYRWGVFDEYPQPGEQHFYDSSSGQVEAVRCTKSITGTMATSDGEACIVPPDGYPGDNCRFYDTRNSPQTASLMYKQFLDYISEFCDEDEDGNGNERLIHNAEAPNRQNRYCEMKSVWQVMTEHSDFVTSQGTVNIQPTKFVRVRQRPARYVIVIDNSASMFARLLPLRQAIYIFINEVLVDGEELGLVNFNDNGMVISNLTTVNDNTRTTLFMDLPTQAEGATTIGGGVEKGLDVLNTTGEINTLGGRLIVLTDERRKTEPFISDIINTTGSVLIHTIAIGNEVDQNLESLATRTGGRQFLHQDSSTALFDIFSQFGVDLRGASAEELVSEYIANFTMADGLRRITFVRDNTLRGGITIYVGVARELGFGLGSEDHFEVRLESPSGRGSQSRFEISASLFIVETNSQEEGMWTLTLQSKDPNALNVSVLVLAETEEDLTNLPITASGFWATSDLNPPQVQTAFVSLSRGYNPVIVPEVEATVETPNGLKKMKLYDDGIGEDIVQGDGIYSGFLSSLDGTGRYSAQFSIRGESQIVNGARVGVGAAVDPEKGQAEWNVTYEPSGDVQRTITGGSFTCNNAMTCTDSNNYGPYQVNNLRRRDFSTENRTVELTFTAPGANLMDGRARSYDIRYSTSFEDFRSTFASGVTLGTAENDEKPYILSGNPNNPSMARNEEIYTIMFPLRSVPETYFFALTATDGTYISPPSNIVSFNTRPMVIPPTMPPFVGSTTLEPTDNNLLPILGASVFLLLLLLLILLLLLLLIRIRKKEKKTEDKIKAVTDDEHFLGASKLESDTIHRNENRHRYDHEEDETRGSGLVNTGGYSGAENRGKGDHGKDDYRRAHRTDLPNGRDPQIYNDTFRNALRAAQAERGHDLAREAERMSFPNGGFDHDIPANVRGQAYDDGVRNAERQTNYNFLPGNPHALRNNVREAELYQTGGDYNFLAVDSRQSDVLSHAQCVRNLSDYQFLPAEAQQYGDLRMANIEYANSNKNGERIRSTANLLEPSPQQGSRYHRV